MKKQCIGFSVLLFLSSGLYAATINEITSALKKSSDSFGLQAFNKNLPTHAQNASFTAWNDAFNQAKVFVIENSKNLFGQKDPILLDAISKLETINMDFINSIKIIRGSLPKAPVSRLLGVASNAKRVTDTLYSESFTMSGKKDAKKLIIDVGRFIEDTAKKLYNMLL